MDHAVQYAVPMPTHGVFTCFPSQSLASLKDLPYPLVHAVSPTLSLPFHFLASCFAVLISMLVPSCVQTWQITTANALVVSQLVVYFLQLHLWFRDHHILSFWGSVWYTTTTPTDRPTDRPTDQPTNQLTTNSSFQLSQFMLCFFFCVFPDVWKKSGATVWKRCAMDFRLEIAVPDGGTADHPWWTSVT